MKVHDLHPHVAPLPESIANSVVEFGAKRLLKHQVLEYVKTKSRPPSATVDMSQLQVDRLLGKGSFSAAYEIDDNFVVKLLQPEVLQKPILFGVCASDLVREGMILRALHHPNIVKCYAMGDLSAFASGRHDACFLVLDRLHCTLKDKLNDWNQHARKPFPYHEDTKNGTLVNALFRLSGGVHRRKQQTISERTDILCQLADALQYLHANRILHRDIKPDNVGLAGGILKVFDFDVSRILPLEAKKRPEKTFKLTRHVGSPRYMAPEVARGEEYNAKADVYSFGLIFFEVLSLRKAYGDIPRKALNQRVAKDGVRPSIPRLWPEPVIDLVQRCWSERAVKRPTMKEVVGQLRATLDLMWGLWTKKDKHSANNRYSDEIGRTQRMESDVETLFVTPVQQ